MKKVSKNHKRLKRVNPLRKPTAPLKESVVEQFATRIVADAIRLSKEGRPCRVVLS